MKKLLTTFALCVLSISLTGCTSNNNNSSGAQPTDTPKVLDTTVPQAVGKPACEILTKTIAESVLQTTVTVESGGSSTCTYSTSGDNLENFGIIRTSQTNI
jgi:hypothetical protein